MPNTLSSLLLGSCLLAVLSGAGAGAEEEEKSVAAVAGKMRSGAEYSVEYRIRETGEAFTEEASKDRALCPLLVAKGCSATGTGALAVTVTFKDEARPHTFRTRGLAEDLYAIQSLRLQKRFPLWFEKA